MSTEAMHEVAAPAAAAGPWPHLRLNPEVSFFELDSAARQDQVLCEVPEASRPGRGQPRRYSLPPALVELLRRFDGCTATEQALSAHLRDHPGEGSEERLRSLVEGFLVPRGFLLDGEEPEPRRPSGGPRRPSYLYLRIPLLSARSVLPVANRMGWVFSRAAFAAWVPLFLTSQVAFFAALARDPELGANRIVVTAIPWMLLLAILGGLAHELGHASAAVHFGCRRIEIGCGIYLFYGVFYADVSEAWRLPRQHRLVVDLGGVYFQSVFMAGLICTFYATGEEMFLFSFFLLELAIAKSFNPFLRLDGYWMMSDLFGIANLRRQSVAMAGRALRRLLGISETGRRSEIQLDPRARRALAIYLISSSAFFAYLTWVILDRFVIELFRGYGDWLAALLAGRAGDGGGSWTELAQAAVEVLWRTVALVGLSFFAFRSLVRLGGAVARARLRRRGRCGAEGAAAGAGRSS
jgi:putative peptide zinc metalloprotease protein